VRVHKEVRPPSRGLYPVPQPLYKMTRGTVTQTVVWTSWVQMSSDRVHYALSKIGVYI
jgi:hypothetical protein